MDIVARETFVRRIKCELPCPTMLGGERDEYDKPHDKVRVT
jgi:hypothetical protein